MPVNVGIHDTHCQRRLPVSFKICVNGTFCCALRSCTLQGVALRGAKGLACVSGSWICCALRSCRLGPSIALTVIS